jgi:dTDP-4-dehydrorhamnose reductase
MKKLLILGGAGMLGHKAYQILSKDFDTHVTFRNYSDRLRRSGLFPESAVMDRIDAFEVDTVKAAIEAIRPDFVLNCIGVIKQLKEAQDPAITEHINAFLPHRIAEFCSASNAKLVHISTDCVFSGRKGDYTEADTSDAEDLYGQTKYRGEVSDGNHLTLRTSIIGRELFSEVSLVDWFLAQRNTSAQGYVNAIYSGFTTIAFCREIGRVLTEFPSLNGLYQVSSEKISKYDLLLLINEIFSLNIRITPYHYFHCDRSLASGRYRSATGFIPPPWPRMIQEMYDDPTPYSNWRRNGSC